MKSVVIRFKKELDIFSTNFLGEQHVINRFFGISWISNFCNFV